MTDKPTDDDGSGIDPEQLATDIMSEMIDSLMHAAFLGFKLGNKSIGTGEDHLDLDTEKGQLILHQIAGHVLMHKAQASIKKQALRQARAEVAAEQPKATANDNASGDNPWADLLGNKPST